MEAAACSAGSSRPMPAAQARRPRRLARSWLRGKAVAIVARGDPKFPQEASAHSFLRSEAAAFGNALGRIRSADEVLARSLDAQLVHGPRGRNADRLAVVANEAPLAHAGPRRQIGNREVVGKVTGHPTMQAIKAAGTRLKGERRTELGLSARPLQEDHEIACDGHGRRMPDILLDHGECEVDPCGDAGGGPQSSILNENRIRLDAR